MGASEQVKKNSGISVDNIVFRVVRGRDKPACRFGKARIAELTARVNAAERYFFGVLVSYFVDTISAVVLENCCEHEGVEGRECAGRVE